MKRIILVDDDPGMRDAFSLIFDATEYEVTIFPNGNHILKNEFDIPDIFILDKQLPGVDGLDICRFLKNQDQTRHLPIVITSASMHIAKLAENAGADAVLEKPFSVEDAKEIVDRLLQ